MVIDSTEPLSDEETFLLSVLAQLCGTVIAKLELIEAERGNAQRIAALNAELESTVSKLTKIMEIHRRLNEIVVETGEMGIAETFNLFILRLLRGSAIRGWPWRVVRRARGSSRARGGYARS